MASLLRRAITSLSSFLTTHTDDITPTDASDGELLDASEASNATAPGAVSLAVNALILRGVLWLPNLDGAVYAAIKQHLDARDVARAALSVQKRSIGVNTSFAAVHDDLWTGVGSIDSGRNTVGPSTPANTPLCLPSSLASSYPKSVVQRLELLPPIDIGIKVFSHVGLQTSFSPRRSGSPLGPISDDPVCSPGKETQDPPLADDRSNGLAQASQSTSVTVESDKQAQVTADVDQQVDDTNKVPVSLKPKTFLGTIGRGGFGDVLLGRLEDGMLVAVKVTHKPKQFRAEGARQALLLELDILRLAALNQMQFVTPLVSSWEDEDNVYFTMPLYPESLRQLQGNQDRLPDDEIKLCAAELIMGLKELHDQRIVHRDIKPDNILISPQGHMTFADFGLSTVDARKDVPFDQVKMHELVGTPGYFAPEVIAPARRTVGYTPAADIFSLGLVFLELLARRAYPFYDVRNDAEQASMMESGALNLEGLIEDKDTKDLLSKMLNFDPTKRATIKEIMAHRYFGGINWESVRERKEAHYSHPPFGPIDENVDLTFRSFHRPPPDRPCSDPYDERELTPWGKVVTNEPARLQMAEAARSCNRWAFHYELSAPGEEHGEVFWESLQENEKVREFLRLYFRQ